MYENSPSSLQTSIDVIGEKNGKRLNTNERTPHESFSKSLRIPEYGGRIDSQESNSCMNSLERRSQIINKDIKEDIKVGATRTTNKIVHKIGTDRKFKPNHTAST